MKVNFLGILCLTSCLACVSNNTVFAMSNNVLENSKFDKSGFNKSGFDKLELKTVQPNISKKNKIELILPDVKSTHKLKSYNYLKLGSECSINNTKSKNTKNDNHLDFEFKLNSKKNTKNNNYLNLVSLSNSSNKNDKTKLINANKDIKEEVKLIDIKKDVDIKDEIKEDIKQENNPKISKTEKNRLKKQQNKERKRRKKLEKNILELSKTGLSKTELSEIELSKTEEDLEDYTKYRLRLVPKSPNPEVNELLKSCEKEINEFLSIEIKNTDNAIRLFTGNNSAFGKYGEILITFSKIDNDISKEITNIVKNYFNDKNIDKKAIYELFEQHPKFDTIKFLSKDKINQIIERIINTMKSDTTKNVVGDIILENNIIQDSTFLEAINEMANIIRNKIIYKIFVDMKVNLDTVKIKKLFYEALKIKQPTLQEIDKACSNIKDSLNTKKESYNSRVKEIVKKVKLQSKNSTLKNSILNKLNAIDKKLFNSLNKLNKVDNKLLNDLKNGLLKAFEEFCIDINTNLQNMKKNLDTAERKILEKLKIVNYKI